MPDPLIPPALTPDEWKERAWLDWKRPGGEGDLRFDGEFSVGYDSGYVYQPIDETPVRLMAIANDALPADSPYKITREDIEAVRDAWQSEGFGVMVGPDDSPLARLAAKLAALLPPE